MRPRECALRLDWDIPYTWFKRNKQWFIDYIYFVLSHVDPKPGIIGYNYRQSSSGHVHVWVFIQSDYWCTPPQRYMLEAMLGGDLARTWYNYHRYMALGMDIDILFARKNIRSVKTVWPGQWFFQA